MKILNLRHIALIVLVTAALLNQTCATTSHMAQTHSTYTHDVDWSKTDAPVQLRMLAEDLSTAEWLMLYADRHRGKRPSILVAPIRNTTGQRVDGYRLQVQLERMLQNRAIITVMAGLAKPDTSRVSPTIPISDLIAMGRSHNAEYLVLSELAASAVPGAPHLTNYQLNLELLDLRTQSSVWSDVRTIRRNETLSN